MSNVRLGVLGFAHGHIGLYCDRWQKQPELGVELSAGWDHDTARAAAACQRTGWRRRHRRRNSWAGRMSTPW